MQLFYVFRLYGSIIQGHARHATLAYLVFLTGNLIVLTSFALDLKISDTIAPLIDLYQMMGIIITMWVMFRLKKIQIFMDPLQYSDPLSLRANVNAYNCFRYSAILIFFLTQAPRILVQYLQELNKHWEDDFK